MWIVTGLWIVGITNAMNLMDGLDGLATGIGCIIGATLTFIAFQADQAVGVFTGLAFLGALLGFLPYNFPPARIFLGDTGALFIGFNLSLLALEGYRKLSRAHLRGAAARARRAADGHGALDLPPAAAAQVDPVARPAAHAPPPARLRRHRSARRCSRSGS